MFRKITCIYVTWFVIILTTCLSGCCGCGKKDSKQFCVSTGNSNLQAYNNADSLPKPANGESIPGKALMLELTIKEDIIICSSEKQFSPINSAYAMSCGIRDTYINTDSIKQVVITADKNYDTAHPAGIALNDYFKETFTRTNEDETIRRYYALQSPEQAGTYTYTIRLLLSNGELIETHIGPLNIIP